MEQSITILLPDGCLVDAKLPARRDLRGRVLAAKYQLGDRVTVEFKNIPFFYDEAAKLPRTWELEKIKLVRRPTGEEFSMAVLSRDWQVSGNLLKPPAASPPPEDAPPSAAKDKAEIAVEQARTVNLSRAAHLPNFIADEVADCYVSAADPLVWQHSASLQSEVAFKGNGETRQHRTLNGRPVSASGVIPGCIGYDGGFGTYLKPLFDPACRTQLDVAQKTGQPGSQAMVFDFSSPPEGCFYSSWGGNTEHWGVYRAYPAHEGQVTIEVPGGNMIYVSDRSVGFPPTYNIEHVEEKVTWDFVNIGDERHLLPVSFEKIMYTRRCGLGRVTARYINHRRFEVDTRVTFQKVTAR